MIKKILLLEDRVTRQINSLIKHNIDLQKGYDLIDNKIEEKFNEVYMSFETFLSNNITTYDVIIAHESKFRGTKEGEMLTTFCRQNKVKLVYYSGGIGSTFYNINNEILYISSNELYSEKLSLFYKDYEINGNPKLLILAYGNKWKTNILLNAIEKLNTYLYQNMSEQPIVYDDFKKKTLFNIILNNKLIDVMDPKCTESGFIDKEVDIKEYIKNLKEKIIEKVYNEL